jgi:hypothetical protein
MYDNKCEAFRRNTNLEADYCSEFVRKKCSDLSIKGYFPCTHKKLFSVRNEAKKTTTLLQIHIAKSQSNSSRCADCANDCIASSYCEKHAKEVIMTTLAILLRFFCETICTALGPFNPPCRSGSCSVRTARGVWSSLHVQIAVRNPPVQPIFTA